MEKFKPVTASGFTSQLLYGNCPTCNGAIASCISTVQTDMLYKPVHNHNCNTIKGTFVCVNGHTVTQSLDAKCSCGWVRSVPFTTELTLPSKLTLPTLPVRSTAKPPQLKPLQLKPPQLKPLQLKPPQLKPLQLKPPQLKPLQLKPPQLKPPQLKPTLLKPPQLKPPQLKPTLLDAIDAGLTLD